MNLNGGSWRKKSSMSLSISEALLFMLTIRPIFFSSLRIYLKSGLISGSPPVSSRKSIPSLRAVSAMLSHSSALSSAPRRFCSASLR